jgi:predicted flap endonuclease-1-like 5' DNA nuclease
MTLNIFTDFCSYWWLAWLLPFLLGLLLGWLIWGRWIKKVRILEEKLGASRADYNKLNRQYKECIEGKSTLESDLRNTKNNLNASNAELRNLRRQQDEASKISGSSIGSAPLAAAAVTPPPIPKKEKVDIDKYAAISMDNLQIIEGIGPKMEQILKENSVNNLLALSKESTKGLRAILDKYGDKYKIIDPSEWVEQAKLAHSRQWDNLVKFQKSDGSESKAEKLFVKMGIIKAFKLNDLKAIEGIGPKISELLVENNIATWTALANTSIDQLRTILNSQGAKYKLSDPSTWPQQAQMAADGDWDRLKELQDQLNIRKA